MKLLIAPDSFKGSLSSPEVIDIVSRAARVVFPRAEVAGLPVADGGEGTADALVRATGGMMRTCEARGPMGDPVEARWAAIPREDGAELAVIEVAQCSGLPLVPKDALDPLSASSHGVGDVIANVLALGYRDLAIALGGSATVDGGAGMLEALGAIFYDIKGNRIPACGGSLGDIAQADLRRLHPGLAEARVTGLCDVTNPLLGERGAIRVFGPQKGVTPDIEPMLESGMDRFARVLSQAAGGDSSFLRFGGLALSDNAGLPGAGAAGGLGFALATALGASLKPGIDRVLDLVGFDEHLRGASLVVTGEGRLDAQSLQGKVVGGILGRCAARGVPAVVIAGSMKSEGALAALLERGGIGAVTCARGSEPLDTVLSLASEYLYAAATRLFALVRAGCEMAGSEEK